LLGVVDEPVGGATAGIVGAATPDPAVRAKGDTFVIGTAGAALTPRLPIS
jgi:ABC-type branched-subunit amino acid transport system permease subunit